MGFLIRVLILCISFTVGGLLVVAFTPLLLPIIVSFLVSWHCYRKQQNHKKLLEALIKNQ